MSDYELGQANGRLFGLIDALRVTSAYMNELAGNDNAEYSAVKALYERLEAKYDEAEASRPTRQS